MKRASAYHGRLVISLETGSVMGRVRRVVADLDHGVLGGLVVDASTRGEGERLVAGDQIESIGEDAIMVRGDVSSAQAGEQQRLVDMIRRETQVYRTGIYTAQGRRLGYLVEPYFDVSRGTALVAFEVFSEVLFADRVRGVLLHGDHVVIGQDLILVPNDLNGYLVEEEDPGLELRASLSRARPRPAEAMPTASAPPSAPPRPPPRAVPRPPPARPDPAPPVARSAPPPPARPQRPPDPFPPPAAVPSSPPPEPMVVPETGGREEPMEGISIPPLRASSLPTPPPPPPPRTEPEDSDPDGLRDSSPRGGAPIDRLSALDDMVLRTYSDSAPPGKEPEPPPEEPQEEPEPAPRAVPAPPPQPPPPEHLPPPVAPGSGRMPPPPPSMGAAASAGGDADERLVKFVLGKVSSRDLRTPTGELIVKKGETIREDSVAKAREHEMMTLLFLAASQTGGRAR